MSSKGTILRGFAVGLAFVAGLARLGAATGPALPTVANASAILIPDHGAGSPSPSSIFVSGVPRDFRKVAVTLNGLTHSFAFDLEVLVVGPNGHGVVLMSATGGGTGMTNVNVSFDDDASQTLPGTPNGAPIGTGSYRPTDLFGEVDNYFGSNAPAGPYGWSLSDFQGEDPNGRWNLYVYDSAEADAGVVAGGWSLTFWDGNGKPVEALDSSALDRWHADESGWPDPPAAVTAYPGGFVAVAGAGIYASSDAYTWARRASITNGTLWGVGVGNGKLVAVGSVGAILTSTDGSNWIRRATSVVSTLRDVAYGDGRFVAVGDSGAAVVSVDGGVTWRSGGGPTNQSLLGVTFGRGVFVAVGDAGAIRVSTDGLQWHSLPPPTNVALASVTGGDGRFVAVGRDARAVWFSEDGTNWVRPPVPPGAGLLDVIYAGGQFVTGGSQGALLSSIDGTNWIARHAAELGSARIQGLAFDGELLLAATAGTANRIFTSDPIHRRAPRMVRPPQDAVVRAGGTITLSFVAAGTTPLACQWQKDGVPLAGATNQSLDLSGFRIELEGAYAVQVVNAIGATTSSVARVTLGLPPVIMVQPLDQAAVLGGNVTMSVAVTGTPPFAYRWHPPSSEETTLTSADRQSFWIVTNIQASGVGTYSVQVSNAFGLELSRGARVSMVADVNADGLPDALEIANGLELLNPANTKFDRDGDGVSDLDELRAGTNPTNAASVLRIRAAMKGRQVSLEFTAETNQTYTVQTSTTLATGPWNRWADFVATTNRRIETITGPLEGSNRYFRVVTPRQP